MKEGKLYNWPIDERYPGVVHAIQAGPPTWRFTATWNESANTLMFTRTDEDGGQLLYNSSWWMLDATTGKERPMRFEDCDDVVAKWCVIYKIEVNPEFCK